MIGLVFLARLFYFLHERDGIKTMGFGFQLRAPCGVNLKSERRRFTVFCAEIILLLLISCPAGIGAQAGATPAAIPGAREVTDELGRKLRLPREVDRVVSLAP